MYIYIYTYIYIYIYIQSTPGLAPENMQETDRHGFGCSILYKHEVSYETFPNSNTPLGDVIAVHISFLTRDFPQIYHTYFLCKCEARGPSDVD